MKRECAVVQDLLMLYEDDVLRKESREMIEEHIKTCEECRKVYEKASLPIPDIQDALPDVKEPVEKSEKEWEEMAVKAVLKFRRKLTFNHMIIAGLVFIAFFLTENLFQDFTADGNGIRSIFTSMPAEDVKVKEMYRLKNGDIYMAFSSEKGFHIGEIPALEGPEYPLQDTDEAYYRVGFKKAWGWMDRLKGRLRVEEAAYVFPIENDIHEWWDEETYQWTCDEISYFGAFKNDKTVLWKEGQKVQEAPPEIEKTAIAAYVRDGYFQRAEEELDASGLSGEQSIYEIHDEYYPDVGASFYSLFYPSTRPEHCACEVYISLNGPE